MGVELGGWEDFVYLDVGFEDNSFDAITLHQVIENISDPIAFLNECARILQPNGWLEREIQIVGLDKFVKINGIFLI